MYGRRVAAPTSDAGANPVTRNARSTAGASATEIRKAEINQQSGTTLGVKEIQEKSHNAYADEPVA